jgi:hypothetical protein
MRNLGIYMLQLREENHDLAAVQNIDELISLGERARVIPGAGYGKCLLKDA